MKNKLGMAAGGILCLCAMVFGQENYAQWHAYRTVMLSNTNSITGGTVTNFPVLVRLSSSNFDFSKASATGSDIRFAKVNGTTHLPYQIERWDTASHTAAVWVLVDTITSATTGATVRMYYGKSGSADSSRGDLVFSTTNNYQGVFHLGEAAGDTARDATGNRFKGIPRNKGGNPPADLTAGLIGKAKNFLGSNTNHNGGSYDIVQANGGHTYDVNPLNFQNDSSTVNGLAQYTISAWVYPDAFPDSTTNRKGIVSKSAGASARQFHLRALDPAPDQINSVNDTNRVEFNDGVGVSYRSGSHRLSVGNWYHVVAVRSGAIGDSTHLTLYVDGGNIFRGSTSLTQTTRSDYDVYIGSYSSDSGYFSGKIDEVEFSNVARDSNWVKLSYQTQKVGAGVVVVSDSIILPLPVAFTYRTSPLVLTTTVAMVSDTPQVTAGAATSWSVTPALPAGLSLSTVTGVISGTPTTAQASANYTVTAAYSGGTTTVVLPIAINAAPAISNNPVDATVTGATGTVKFGIHATGTPAPTYRWIRTRGAVIDTPSNGGTAPAAVFSGMTTDTMTITNPPYSDSNSTYKCLASNIVGSAVSTAATLKRVVGIIQLGPFVVKVPGLRPFSYRVPEGSVSVLMTVEDIQGRVVWSKEMATGKSRVVAWTGKDSNGRGVSSGMYVVKLKLLDALHSSLGEIRQTGGITR